MEGTIHSLKLPIRTSSHKDPSGQTLSFLQTNLGKVEYILIDKYSMLGQNTMGWIDRNQITGLKEEVFGGKSFILIEDPSQLPPVGDQPLYHAKQTNDTSKQCYLAYLVNQRVSGLECEQTIFLKSFP